MITVQDVENSPFGISYVTRGDCKNHILELVREIQNFRSSDGTRMTDDQFQTYILNKLTELDTQIDELFDGMNRILDTLRANNIQI